MAAEDKHSVLVRIFVFGIAGLIVCAYAFEDIDESLFLLLLSRVEPPPDCPENEVWKTCFGNCSDCQRRGVCLTDGCTLKGCDCIHNFVRVKHGGPCEPVHACPVPECGENEVFRECGAVCEHCGAMRCRMVQCDHRCYCKQGHLRDGSGKCVPEHQCPSSTPTSHCLRDEDQGTSGRVDEYCLRDETSSNETETRDRCYCKEGYSRNPVGHCVKQEWCEKIRCSGVEVYQSCPPKCNTTCRNFGEEGCEEDGQCYPGCFCPEGHLVDDFRRCVTPDECPPGSNPFAPTAPPTSTATATATTPTDPPTVTTQVSSSIPSATSDAIEAVQLSEVSKTTASQPTTTAAIGDGTTTEETTQETTTSPATTTSSAETTSGTTWSGTSGTTWSGTSGTTWSGTSATTWSGTSGTSLSPDVTTKQEEKVTTAEVLTTATVPTIKSDTTIKDVEVSATAVATTPEDIDDEENDF